MAFFGRETAVRRRPSKTRRAATLRQHLIQAEKPREADLSTQQAGAQAPSWISRPYGHHGRPQGGRSPAQAGPQAAQRLIPEPAHRDGPVEAAGGFPGRSQRGQGCDGGIRAAGTQARRRRAGADRLHGVAQGRNRGRAQSRAAAAAGHRPAFDRRQSAVGVRLRAGGAAHRLEPAIRPDDRGLQQRATTSWAHAPSPTYLRGRDRARGGTGRAHYGPMR
jgi:hypothetical protein